MSEFQKTSVEFPATLISGSAILTPLRNSVIGPQSDESNRRDG